MWEARTPLTPDAVREIISAGVKVYIQPSKIRIFKDDEYREVGAIVQDDLRDCDVIFCIKEIPPEFIEDKKTYVFFSHTIKGQKHNMPMLKKLIEKKCHLIDYEMITDGRGNRLIFFGRFAGIAGMIDILWALGVRLKWEGIDTPFEKLKQTLNYESLEEAKKAVKNVGREIEEKGLPDELTPFICGFAGYGNVSQGAQEIFDLLPYESIIPTELKSFEEESTSSKKKLYKVVFKEKDMVEPISPDKKFELQDYYDHPENYKSKFHIYLPHLTILMNCIYWDPRYPRFVRKDDVKELYDKGMFKLRIIGDISCDINGAIEFTVKATDPGNPFFTYNPFKDSIVDGVTANGIAVLAVDNLPCELAREASIYFSNIIKKYVPIIAKEDFSKSYEELQLPPEIMRALILQNGEFTPDYKYMEEFIREG